jgi:hypothetical protein
VSLYNTSLYISAKFRVLFSVLSGFGMAIIYGFKVNLSVAIVAMVNQTALKEAAHYVDPISYKHANGTATIHDLNCAPPVEHNADGSFKVAEVSSLY